MVAKVKGNQPRFEFIGIDCLFFVAQWVVDIGPILMFIVSAYDEI